MKHLVLALAWVASVAVAFVVGQNLAGPSTPEGGLGLERAETATTLDEDAARLEGGGARPVEMPREEASLTEAQVPADQAELSVEARKLAAEGDLEAFLQSLEDPTQAHALLRARLAALLEKGPEGHLEAVAMLDQLLQNKSLERFFGGSEEQAARFIYPWIRFLVQREGQVVALTETVFKTMAEDPQRFEGMDDDTLEVFTEGLAMVLPGAIDEKRLETFRGYAKAVLEAPEANQSKAVVKNRNEIERLLQAWAPPMSTDEILEALRSGQVDSRQLGSMLTRLKPEDLQKVDLVPVLVPLLQQGDYRAMRAMQSMGASALGGLGPFDAAILDGLAAGTVRAWQFQTYLGSTGRMGWPAAERLVEIALARGGKATESAAQTLMRLSPKPDAVYVQSVLDRYDLGEGTRRTLKASFKLE